MYGHARTHTHTRISRSLRKSKGPHVTVWCRAAALPLSRACVFQFVTVPSPPYCTTWSHVSCIYCAISLVPRSIWIWDSLLCKNPKFQAKWPTCCFLSKLCLKPSHSSTSAQAAPSGWTNFLPLFPILTFSPPHPSRPSMQMAFPVKPLSISWVHLSLCWTNRAFGVLWKIAPFWPLSPTGQQLCVSHISVSAGNTQMSNLCSSKIFQA